MLSPVRRKPLLISITAVVAVSVALVVSAGLSALTASDALDRARTGLVRAQDAQTSTAESLAAVARAQRDIAQAGDAIDGWHVDVVAAVPLLGRSWDVLREVTRTAKEVIDGASVLGDGFPAVRAENGAVDLAALAEVRRRLAGPAERSKQALEALEKTSSGFTPRQVSEGRAAALDALSPAVDTLAIAQQGLALASGLLGESGPRSLLVMLQNNAELRGSGGYAASFATGRLEDGAVTLDPLQDVRAVGDPPELARRVPAPQEYLEDFGRLAINSTTWRMWNMSPHVPDSALVGARIAGALLPRQPDVVVLLDVPAMAALASLDDGAIRLPDGSTVSPDELTKALLVDAYAEAGADRPTQIRRRADLQAAATLAVTRLLGEDIPAAEAARTIGRLARARHLVMWSAHPEEQAALAALGAAGAVEPPPGGDLAHVSVNNLAGNKVDLYVERDISVDVVLHERHAEVVQRVVFTNRAPEDLVPYVAGRRQPGTAVSRVELSIPAAAKGLTATVDGGPWPGTAKPGAVRQRVTARHELPRGASSVMELRYTLPVQDRTYRLRIIPQALVDDASLALSIRAAEGQRLESVDGADLRAGTVQEVAALEGTREVTAALGHHRPTRWERLRAWWDSPVRLG